MEQNPTWASQMGDRRWNDRWPDLSPKNRAAREQHDRDVLRVLTDELHRAKLPAADAVNYDCFRRRYELIIEGYPLNWELIPLDQRGGIQSEDSMVDTLRFDTPKGLRRITLPAFVRSRSTWTKRSRSCGEGIAAHMVQPRIVMQRVPGRRSDKQIVDDARRSRFYKTLRIVSQSFTTEQIARYRSDAEEAIEGQRGPGVRPKFKAFFNGEYLPACMDDIGVWRLPNGQKLYQHFIREHTTTNLTADEDPRDRPARSRADRSRDGRGDEVNRLHRHARSVLPVPAYRQSVSSTATAMSCWRPRGRCASGSTRSSSS
jgi:prolyl oligopeptidase